MQKYMRVCPICAKENIRKEGHSKIYVPGWIDSFLDEQYADTTCIWGHKDQKLIKMSMTCEEFQILRYVSNEPSFMQAMNDLKESDPIEYQLKLSQFKTQVQQQQETQRQDNNIPKCPTCGSTNIKKISGLSKAGSVAMWGLLSRKAHKQWHCNSCGSEW